MKRTTTVLAMIAAFATSTLVGCAVEDTPAEVVATADETNSDADETPEPEETEEAETTAEIGDTVAIGDWDVKITDINYDAGDVIQKANQFNDKAKGQYVLVVYEATYNGSERTADAAFDLDWSVTTPDRKVHDPSSQVTPQDNANDQNTEARSGGTVTASEVFDLKPNEIDGTLLTVEGYDAGFDTVYADFVLTAP